MAVKNPLPPFAQQAINRDITIGNIPNIVAGSAIPVTVSIPVTLGWCYNYLLQELSNLANLTSLQLVRLLVNEDPIWTIAGTELDALNQYDGLPAYAPAANPTQPVLCLPLVRPNLISANEGIYADKSAGAVNGTGLISGAAKDQQYETGLNLGGQDAQGNQVQNCLLELTFTTTANPAPISAVTGIATTPYSGGPGLLRRIDRYTGVQFAAQMTLQKGQNINIGDPTRALLTRLIFFPPANVSIDRFTLTYQNTGYKVRSSAVNRFLQTVPLGGVRKPNTAGIVVLDFSEELWGDTPLFIGNSQVNLNLAMNLSGGGLGNAGVILQESMGYAAGFAVPSN